MYYIYVMSGPSLLIESTDSMVAMAAFDLIIVLLLFLYFYGHAIPISLTDWGLSMTALSIINLRSSAVKLCGIYYLLYRNKWHACGHLECLPPTHKVKFDCL